jgi:RNA polymerase sigma-70 factor (ECF subfamily)
MTNAESEPATSALVELIPTRQSLLSRLKNWDDQESWRAFFETYWRLIYSTAIRAGLTDPEAQDVVQETVSSVLKALPGFRYQSEKGSFKSWLLNLTRWRIVDQLRKRQKNIASINANDTGTGTAPIERIADPGGIALDATWDKEWESNLMEAAIERVKQKVDPKQYQIFDLYVVKGWPVAKVAEVLGTSRSNIYIIKHRIGSLIKKEVARLHENPV